MNVIALPFLNPCIIAIGSICTVAFLLTAIAT